MSNERQETVADIVREMRIGDLCAEDTSASRPEYINDILASYAARIEAAHKREREAGTEAAQICGEIGEMIGREATTEKSSAVGNAAAMREALEKVRFYLPYFLQYVRLHDAQSGGCYEKKLEVVAAAISAPPRNCDVGTAEE